MNSVFKSREGFTLIEVLVSLAIIGLIATVFLPIFSGGLANIFDMGRSTQTMNHEAQMYMDQIYNGRSKAEIMAEDDRVSIDDSESINGMTLVTITIEYGRGNTITLSSLVP